MGRHKKIVLDQLTQDSIRATKLGISYGQLKAREWDGQPYRKILYDIVDKHSIGYEKKCPVCGITFRTSSEGQKACGVECEREHKIRKKIQERGQAARAYAPQPGVIREDGKITVLDGNFRYVRLARTLADCNDDRIELVFQTLRTDAKWMTITAVKREGLQSIWYIRQEKDGLFAIRK